MSTPTIARITDVLAHHAELHVTGLPLDDTHQLLLVTADEGMASPTGVLLCIATPTEAGSPPIDCAATDVEVLEGVAATTGSGWLVAAESAYGNPRDNTRMLLSVVHGDHGLALDKLELGGIAGDGHACEHNAGYCVDVRGAGHAARILAPTCIEVRPGAQWSATHVRVGDRWIHETIEPAPGCIERYAIRDGHFERADCGPPSSEPRCPDAGATTPEEPDEE